MNKHYVIPVGFAVAAHGALLFGFTKDPRPAAPRPVERVFVEYILRAPEDPPEVVPSSSDSVAKSPPAAPVLPRSDEPLIVDHGVVPTMTLPPFQPPVSRSDVTIIPANLIGVLGGNGDKPFGDVIGTGLLDNPPRTRLQVSPMYPHDAKHVGTTGEVMVEFLVDEGGNVVEPRVVKSSDRVFEDATLRAVAKWKFEPGRQGGRIVKFRMAVPIVFNLNN